MPEWLADYLDPATLLPLGIALGQAIATVVLGYIVAGWVQGGVHTALQRAKLGAALATFLASIARYVVIFATIISAAGTLGFDTTSLTAIFASAGLAVGLAMQGSLSSFAAGVMILWFRPFDIGDVVTITGYNGQVKEIGLFASTLGLPDGTRIVVPNASITSDVIQNHTVKGKRRGTVEIGVAYGTDVAEVRAALTRAAQRVPQIKDEDFALMFVSFGDSSLNWVVHGHCTPEDYLPMLESLNVEIYNELNAANIEIPYPQLVLHKAEA